MQEVYADAPLILALHPYQKYSTLMRKYTPLADYLSEALQREVVVRIGKDYQDHVAYIGKNRVDIAIMGPVSSAFRRLFVMPRKGPAGSWPTCFRSAVAVCASLSLFRPLTCWKGLCDWRPVTTI